MGDKPTERGRMTLEEKRLEKLEELVKELKAQGKTSEKKKEQASLLEWLINDKYLQIDLQKHDCH